MSFALLAPLGLAALAALVLPLVIHLVRRIELRTTEFAALRWISERIRPRRRLRFERPWLLLLRLALLAAIALLLARPVFEQPPIASSAWVVVAPGSDLAAAHAAVSVENADWRWLAPGFPSIETSPPSVAGPIASLLREIDANLPRNAKLVAVVPETLAGLDGERPKLSRVTDWDVVPGSMPSTSTAPAHEAIALAVRYAPAAEPMLKYLRAAASALDAQGTHITLDMQPQDAAIGAARALVWLGSEPPASVRKWIEAGGTAIVDHASRSGGVPIWRDDEGDVIARAQPFGRGRLVALAGAFAPETLPALLDADFPQHLFELVRVAPAPPTRAPAEAMRPTLAPTAIASALPAAATKPLDPWLALLIAMLILLERIVAMRSRVAP